MTIFCYGSINIDHVHRVPHFPAPGETLADLGYQCHLGGKGANQALAAAASGAEVRMIGAVGADGGWARERMAASGIDVSGVQDSQSATGHAVIYVTPDAENQIVLHGGANQGLTAEMVETALQAAKPGDWWLCQNETNRVAEAAKAARASGLRVAYAAAPFQAEDAVAVLPYADLVAVNAGEAAALAAHLGQSIETLPIAMLLVTDGSAGARLLHNGTETSVPAFAVNAVDTTGAGDTFLGTLLAGLDLGHPPDTALTRAAAAAALQVTRPGAGDAIPTIDEVDAFLKEHV
ncbi:MAG: PfkB family carbohydrate kinase [Pseudomonadota bacterium]